MAVQQNNSVMYGTRGLFNKQVVFKKRLGKDYVAGPPTKDPNRVATAGQAVQQAKFRRCINYVKKAVKNVLHWADYKAAVKDGQTALNVAFQDAWYGPAVASIDTSLYKGKIGDSIIINATDNFKVSSVQVAIYTMDNELVEQGAAVLDAEGLFWTYKATEDHVALEGSTIKATAKDLPGNEGSLTITL